MLPATMTIDRPVIEKTHALSHGRAALAEGPRPRTGHAPGCLWLAGMETI